MENRDQNALVEDGNLEKQDFDSEHHYGANNGDELGNFQEDESDLGTEINTEAVVATVDWTVETIVRQLDIGLFDLEPSFQRREAWKKERKSSYIESLMLKLPTPSIILAESVERSKYIVIDGKQRLLTLAQFVSESGKYESLKLSRLRIQKNASEKTLGQIWEVDPLLARSFLNYPIRTVLIKGWKDEKLLHLIFYRINTSSMPLSPHEVRAALHPGRFLDYIGEASGTSMPIKTLLGLKGPDSRMRDTELVLRYFAFTNLLHKYEANFKDFLDECAKDFNEQWPKLESKIKNHFKRLENAIELTREIFGEHYFRRWEKSGKYSKSFNRAIFDVMVYYFSQDAVERVLRNDGSKGKYEQIRDEFKNLCLEEDFIRAITYATKDTKAISDRLSMWGERISRITDLSKELIYVPSIKERRIDIEKKKTYGLLQKA